MNFQIPPIRDLAVQSINETIRHIQLYLDRLTGEISDHVRYVGPYVSGEYYHKGTIMGNGDWLMIANKGTFEYPYPQPTGPRVWLVYGDSPPALSQGFYTGTTTTRGHRYTFNQSAYINAQRWYSATDNGQLARLVLEITPPGGELYSLILASVAQQNIGWSDPLVGHTIIRAGTVISQYAQYSNPNNSVDTEANYNYITPPQDRVSAAGEIIHSDRALDTLHVNKTDADGIDRSALIDSFTRGDGIIGSLITWGITEVIASDANEAIFRVSPQVQETMDGVQPFILRKFGISNLYYGREPDFLDPFPNIDSFYALEDGVRVYGNLGRGWDLQVQEAIVPQDWDVLQTP